MVGLPARGKTYICLGGPGQVIVMVGLPARGKTYIAKKLTRKTLKKLKN